MNADQDPQAKILVVDDEPANVRLLERILQRAGYTEIHYATNGRTGLRQVDDTGPDLILLDLHMPEMDGFEVLERLRDSLPVDSYLPVLILTADASTETKLKALDAGAMDFLIKPFDATEVVLRVRNLLHTRRLHLHMEAQVRERTRALEESQLEVLERLAHAAEFRDDDTGQHTKRVGEVAANLARAMGLPDVEVELIRRAAPLHDVGKIGVSDTILLKRGKLTDEEFALIKEHTLMGARILGEGRAGVVLAAEQIAHCHHEKWDGSGYPRGLRGEEIPLAARIVAVADVFDALSSERPYRPAWPREKVLEEIERGSGSHFDPDVVRAFLETTTSEDSNGNPFRASSTAQE